MLSRTVKAQPQLRVLVQVAADLALEEHEREAAEAAEDAAEEAAALEPQPDDSQNNGDIVRPPPPIRPRCCPLLGGCSDCLIPARLTPGLQVLGTFRLHLGQDLIASLTCWRSSTLYIFINVKI